MASEDGHVPENAGETGTGPEQKQSQRRSSPIRWTAGLIVRLCIWYALLTPFLRCPSRLSELNESSPSVCKPYLVARSHVEPHILPYYDTYAAPYVDRVRPYVVVLDEKVYTPVAKVSRQGYDTYGAPALDQAQVYARSQWDAQVTPRLQSAQDYVNGMYKASVEPHVQRGKGAVSPYYEKANAAFLTVFWDHVFPFYARSRPFIGKTYTSGQDMLTTTVLPYAQSSWSSAIFFANSQVWPMVTGLYSENVEPQLVKIGQRLASYREGKRLRGVAEEFNGSSEPVVTTTNSVSPKTSYSSTASTVTSTTQAWSAHATPQTSLSPTEEAAQTREIVASDLRRWQEKFAVAADKGVEDLEERLQAIIESHIESGIKDHAGSLTVALETVIENELSTVKRRINSLAESLPFEDVPSYEEHAQDELLNDLRGAAVSIRERAHAIRGWYNAFDDELIRRVSASVNSTLNILDNVRDLGLQEIGIRWAWMDGVTYKDWENYHTLKAQFADWREKIKDVGMQHKMIEEARNLASGVLDQGMDAAEASAKELGRLKDVGKWKIAAREAGDDFSTRTDSPPTWPKPGSESDSAEGDETQTEAVDPESAVEFTDTGSPAQTSVSSEETIDADFNDGALVDDQPVLAENEEDSPIQESRSVASIPTTSTGADFHGSTTEGQINEEVNGCTRNAWGVAAAEVAPEQLPIDRDSTDHEYESLDRSSSEQPEEDHELMGSVTDGVSSKGAHQADDGESASQQKTKQNPQYEAVQDLVSELLAGKDSDLAESVIDRLHAMYEMPLPSASSYAYESASSAFVTGTRESESEQPISTATETSEAAYGV